MAENQRDRDLVLSEGQYAYVQDQTKGHIGVYCGPYKTSIAMTDQPVRFNPEISRFERCTLEEAIREFVQVSEGSYVVLANPAKDNASKHPAVGNSTRTALEIGRTVVIPGPAAFALWPGQHAKVVEGHRLRSNQYLVARVYNDDEARRNWDASILRPASAPEGRSPDPQTGSQTEPGTEPDARKTEAEMRPTSVRDIGDLIMGQKLIIRGTEVSFFIPPTGVEVEPDELGNYVREAVTLERLEYCLLLAENGAKRYVRGPDVVFPEPNESFVQRGDERKFRAIELNDDMGIHIKVIADYEDGDRRHAAGEELFLTGRERRIYYPREEHAVIKYGDRDRVYGVVIPKGEARYVLNKDKGDIELIEGPRIFLPDPRKQVIVRRVLTEQQVADWFPGNRDADVFNARLRQETADSTRGFVPATPASFHEEAARSQARRLAGESFDRGTEFTPPRSITIDSRFDGAVQICPWIGYAVLVIGKSGQRRVIVGPDATLLRFDEVLQVLTLSTCKPKSSDRLMRTAYLAMSNNQVSDIVEVVTRDMVRAEIKLSYRVNFVGETEEQRLRWFSVQNYVKFLCDHLRSLLRSACKRAGIEELAATAASIVRDTVLGEKSEKGGKRPGRLFEENGMHVSDVEILDVVIGDAEIARTLVHAQHQAVSQTLAIAAEESALELERRRQEIARQRLREQEETAKLQTELAQAKAEREFALKLAQLAADAKAAEERRKLASEEDEHKSLLHASDLERMKARNEVEAADAKQKLELRLGELAAEAEAHAKRFGAVSPQFIAALEAFGQSMLTIEAGKAMAPLAILGGESVADVLHRLFKGTKLEPAIEALKSAGSNGSKALPVAAG